MFPRRAIIASAVLGWLGLRHGARASTPEPDFPYFAGIARLDEIPPGWGAGINRVRLEPDQVWDFTYPGPVSVYVDSGVMTVTDRRLGRFTMGDNQGSGSSGASHEPAFEPPHELPSNQIEPGSGVFAPDGDLGPLSNEGAETLVLFILSAVPPTAMTEEIEEAEASPVSDCLGHVPEWPRTVFNQAVVV